jgi:hypothetical protein
MIMYPGRCTPIGQLDPAASVVIATIASNSISEAPRRGVPR